MSAEDVADVKLAASSMYGGKRDFVHLFLRLIVHIFTGGADTTVSAEYAFFLAMVLNPGRYTLYHLFACS
jgi:hypothetical protein